MANRFFNTELNSMNNATTYRQGNNTHYYEQTIPTASRVGTICRVDAKVQKPQRNTRRQTQVRTAKSSTNGFLNMQFLPKTKINEHQKTEGKTETQKIEKDFYKSLNQITEHYDIQPIITKDLLYPNNLNVAYWDIKNKLKKHLKNNQKLHIIKTEEEQTVLSVSKSYETDSYLHYLCVYPLFIMLNDKKDRQTKDLLVSIFSYLYRVVGIPFYRDEDTYLFYLYDMLKEWLLEDDAYCEYDDANTILSEITKNEYIGDTILKKIQDENNLTFWKQRLDSFYIKNEFDKQLFYLAKRFYSLWQDYPHENIFRYAKNEYDYNENEDFVPMYKYLSFTCFFEGSLYEQMTQIINNDLAEYAEMEEPTIYELFNGDKIDSIDFDFEHRFFTLFNELTELIR